MKNTMLALLVMSSFSTVAADLSQAQEAVSHTDRYSDSINNRPEGSAGVRGDSQDTMGAAIGAERAQAHADLNSAQTVSQNRAANMAAVARADQAQAVADRYGDISAHPAVNQAPYATPTKTPTTVPNMQPQAVPQATPHKTPSYSVPTPTAQLTPQIAPNEQLTPSYSVPTVKQQLTPQAVPTKQPQITGASYRAYINQLEQAQTINVAVSSLKPSTLVNVTVNGITKTTTAGVIAAVNPSVQVAVPHVPAFQVNTGKGSKNDKASSHSFGGSGNGANNAANTNSAHGLGGGPHIGGGSAMGGGFHGSW